MLLIIKNEMNSIIKRVKLVCDLLFSCKDFSKYLFCLAKNTQIWPTYGICPYDLKRGHFCMNTFYTYFISILDIHR